MSMLKGKVRLRLYVCVYVIFLFCALIAFVLFYCSWVDRNVYTTAESKPVDVKPVELKPVESKPIEVTVDGVSFQCDSGGTMRNYKIEIDFNGNKGTLTGYENYSKCSGKIGEKVKAHLNKYTNKKGQSIFQIELD